MGQTKQVNGVIESVNFGTAKDGDYGRSAPCWVKINGDSYSCFAKEHNGVLNLQTKVGEAYVDIKVGMQVVFNATQKDGSEYWNFKPLTVVILGGTPQPTQQPQQQPVAQQPATEEKVATNAPNDLTVDGLKDMVADGQAASNALIKGKTPTMDMLKRVSGFYRKVL